LTPTTAAVVAPGYGATAEQPIVRAVVAALEGVGIAALGISFSRKQPVAPFDRELDELRRARDGFAELGVTHVALIGRSFGGRMCARLAALEPPAALVLLGHPIAPEGRPRPDDEAALAAVQCPTLIVQGERDKLGPLAVLDRIAAVNRNIELIVLPGVGHSFGPRTKDGIRQAVAWLSARS
jgi:predicted alpha/beta-hydrolase family hydrolase